MFISLGIQPLLISFHDSKVQVRAQPRGIDLSVLEEIKEIKCTNGIRLG